MFEVWQNFNKQQSSLKGPMAQEWMNKINQSSKIWASESYPKGEYWKYLKFDDLSQTKLQPALAQGGNSIEVSENRIDIQINDFSGLTEFKPVNLPEGLKIYGHQEVMESDELTQKLLSMIKKSPEENKLSEVNYSFMGLGLFIEVADKKIVDQEIYISFDLNSLSAKDVFAPFSTQILVGEQSQATVFVEVKSDNFAGFSNIRFDATVKKAAQLNMYSKEKGGAFSRTMFHNFVDVERDALFNFFDLTLPGQWSRHNTVASLLDNNAEARLNGIYLNDNDYFCDHHTEIRHLKEHTESSQDYKGILSDSAHAVFNGKVFIEKMAKKSNSEQLNKNLMLSKKSEIDTKPELQIYNDDVKAAHGATIGKIDEEQLFYLQSRGYSKKEAWRSLAKAFVYDSLEDRPQSVRDFFEKDISASLEQFKEL
ncbi:MAG: Fe-S cluster assembly protein SufD [Bdellovibrionales bacterium]|nr:Fe-S cluster assembly protein SufD [Bdellovibrionales bacterium]